MVIQEGIQEPSYLEYKGKYKGIFCVDSFH